MTTIKLFNCGEDADAISTPLAVFDTQPLLQVRWSCTRSMRKKCMSVFYYWADKLKISHCSLMMITAAVTLMLTSLMKALIIMNMTFEANDSLFNVHEISGSNFSQESFHHEIANITEEVNFSVVPEEKIILFCMMSLTKSFGRETINTG